MENGLKSFREITSFYNQPFQSWAVLVCMWVT